MAETCREICPILVWAESQGRAANLACRSLSGLYMRGIDKLTEAAETGASPSSVIEAQLETAQEMGPRIAEMAGVYAEVESGINRMASKADANCYGPEVEMDKGRMQAVIRCGGFTDEEIAGLIDIDKILAATQARMDRALGQRIT